MSHMSSETRDRLHLLTSARYFTHLRHFGRSSSQRTRRARQTRQPVLVRVLLLLEESGGMTGMQRCGGNE